MLSYEEYIEAEKKKIRDKSLWDVLYANLGKKKNESKDKRKKRAHAYRKTEEFKNLFEQELLKDARYAALSAPDVTIKREYEKYRKKEAGKEEGDRRKDQIAKSTEDLLRLAEENNEMLCENAEYISKNVRRRIRKTLSEKRLGGPWKNAHLDPGQTDITERFYRYALRHASEKAKNYPSTDDYYYKICSLLRAGEQEERINEIFEGLDGRQKREVRSRFLKEGKSRLSGLRNRVREAASFSEEEISKMLLKNPFYGEAIEAYEDKKRRDRLYRERMEQGILDRISDDPVDMYPLAREMDRHFVLHIGPTNSGKTHDALEVLKTAETGVYLAPLRLLAFECFEELNRSGTPCSLITGEEERIVPGSFHTASTIELLSTTEEYDVAVIDETQMISDAQRGGSWTAAVLGVRANEIHVCAAPQAEKLLLSLIEMCGDTAEVFHHERMTSLRPDESRIKMNNLYRYVQKNDALIVFSKWKVLACAADLQRNKIRCSVIYGSLPYEVRQNEAKRFANGETDVVVSTDAIGMGMNLPIKRIVFLEDSKYDGKEVRMLANEEIRQIAGRAGRAGIFEEGTYTSVYGKTGLKLAFSELEPDLNEAYLNFGKMFVEVPGCLSEIMTRWTEMDEKGVFKKPDMSEQISLCEELEEMSDDKNLIYEFSMIPFDTQNAYLHDMWRRAFVSETKGERLEFSRPYYDETLDSLEDAYKYCDLMYYYLRRFSDGEWLADIMDCKREITEKMNEILKKRRLPGKKCSRCGKNLPWNYPRPMCEKCLRRNHGYGYDPWD